MRWATRTVRSATASVFAVLLAAGRAGDLPVHFVVSDNPGLGRGDGAWLEVRDPTGAFRRTFEAIGALDDGYMGLDELQAMFARALEEQGNPVAYEVMPNSTHESISPEGWPVFLDAFKRAATAGG